MSNDLKFYINGEWIKSKSNETIEEDWPPPSKRRREEVIDGIDVKSKRIFIS